MWHRLQLIDEGGLRVEVEVRRWSVQAEKFVSDGAYTLCLPQGENVGLPDLPATNDFEAIADGQRN